MSEISFGRTGMLGYLRFTPDGFSEKKRYPIIIHFHGAGSRGSDTSILQNQAIMQYAKGQEDFPFVLFLPQCHEDTWFDLFEKLRTFVEWAVSLPFVDAEKVYLSGVSMGGYASWQMLASKPTTFRKAVICCGGGMYWNAGRIKTPVWAFHGVEDKTVFVEESRKMVEAVNRYGGKASLTEYEGVEHNCWDRAYSNPAVYRWLLEEEI